MSPALKPPVDADRDHVRGPADAALTLLEYGDYECPHCAMAHGLVEPLLREFGDRLRLAWRHFPRPEHPRAHHAAEAAEAAGAQGLYWDMHATLLTHQRALTDTDLERYAEELGLDMERFRADFRGHVFHQRVAEDLSSAVHSGAHGTPTFFINGVLHLGPDDFQDLRESLQTVFEASSGRAPGGADTGGASARTGADEISEA